jgi:hypothetical protein
LSPELEAREAFKRLRASKFAAESMIVHRSCVSIQRDGCAFLSNCAVNIEKQFVAFVPMEELEAVVQAMAHHKHEVSVMQGACFALKNYTHEEKNTRTLRHCRGIDDLMAHASTYEASANCMADAGDVLERMQVSRSVDESLEDQAYMSLLHIVESQANTPQASRSILDFMRNYDWSPRLIGSSLQMFRNIVKNGKDDQEISDRLYENGMLQEIIRYCQKFERTESVCEEACSLIAFLCTKDDGRHVEIIEAGSCGIIFKSLELFGRDNEELVKNALEALKLMSTNLECFNQVKEKMHLVTDAIEAHQTSEMVQINGVAVVSSLDYFQSARR